MPTPGRRGAGGVAKGLAVIGACEGAGFQFSREAIAVILVQWPIASWPSTTALSTRAAYGQMNERPSTGALESVLYPIWYGAPKFISDVEKVDPSSVKESTYPT